MSVQLLDRTRKINKLLHNSSSSKVVFNDICQVLMETLSSNILVLSKKGKVLGISLCPGRSRLRRNAQNVVIIWWKKAINWYAARKPVDMWNRKQPMMRINNAFFSQYLLIRYIS